MTQILIQGRMSGKALRQRKEVCEAAADGRNTVVACLDKANADRIYQALLDHIAGLRQLEVDTATLIGRLIHTRSTSGRTATIRVTCPKK